MSINQALKMKKQIILGLLCVATALSAQTKKSNAKATEPQPAPSEQFGFVSERTQPRYMGGKEAMSKFIYSNMSYPQDAKDKGLQGDVQVQFFVDVDGTVKNVSVVKGVCKSIDEEAIRVVSAMPKWIPGKNGSVNIIMKSSLIIGFHL